jgi:hypothetical protein
MNNILDNVCWFLAYHVLPSKLIEKCFIRIATYGSTRDLSSREFGTITVLEAFDSWMKRKENNEWEKE